MLVLAASYLYWSLAKDAGADDTAFLSNKIQECRRLLRDGPKGHAPSLHTKSRQKQPPANH